MINLKINATDNPIVTEMSLGDTAFEIELLPCTPKEWGKHFQPFRKSKNIPNVLTKEMNMLHFFDDKDPKFLGLLDDLIDKYVKNFWGIALNGKELDGTLRENKLLLASITVEDEEEIKYTSEGQSGTFKQKRERYFRALIFDKIQDLASVKIAAEKD